MKKTTWWRNSLTGLGVLALVSAASPAAAQRYSRDYPQNDSRDHWQDRQDLGQDRASMRDDWMDVRRLQRLMAQLDDAQQRRDQYREERARDRIDLQFRNEIAETRHEVARDRREAYRSSRSGDPRDFRDDQNDLQNSQVRLQELNRVYQRFLQLEPAARAHDWRAMRREDRVLSRFLQLTREDAMASNRELNEDRQNGM